MNNLLLVYNIREKIIALAARATLIYYSIATIRELIELYDQGKVKFHEACRNAQYINDYIYDL
jgi:hypothetical protein